MSDHEVDPSISHTFSESLLSINGADALGVTGDVEGPFIGVRNALRSASVSGPLIAAGWHLSDAVVVVADDPALYLTTPGIEAVVITGRVMFNHRRIVRSVGSRGMTITVLRLEDQAIISIQTVVLIDATLPSGPTVYVELWLMRPVRHSPR